MCKQEAYGNLHSHCNHFIVQWRGKITRCDSKSCENSPSHPGWCNMRSCVGRGVYTDENKIQNVFRYCDSCQEHYSRLEQSGRLDDTPGGHIIKQNLKSKGRGREPALEAAQRRMAAQYGWERDDV